MEETGRRVVGFGDKQCSGFMQGIRQVTQHAWYTESVGLSHALDWRTDYWPKQRFPWWMWCIGSPKVFNGTFLASALDGARLKRGYTIHFNMPFEIKGLYTCARAYYPDLAWYTYTLFLVSWAISNLPSCVKWRNTMHERHQQGENSASTKDFLLCPPKTAFECFRLFDLSFLFSKFQTVVISDYNTSFWQNAPRGALREQAPFIAIRAPKLILEVFRRK